MPIALGIGTAAGSLGAAGIGYFGAKDAANTQAQSGAQALALQSMLGNRQYDMALRGLGIGQDVGGNALALGRDVGNTALGVGQGAANTALGIGTGAAAGYAPWIGAGQGALTSLAQLYGVPTPGNPSGGSQSINQGWQSFLNTPAYQFAAQQGNLGLDRSAASKGLLLSGGQMKDAMTFNQGLASQQIGNYTNVLSGMAGQGLQATQASGNTLMDTIRAYLSGTGMGIQGFTAGNDAGIRGYLGGNSAGINALTSGATNTGNMANVLGNTTMGIGQSNASGIVGGTNALMGGVNNASQNALLMYGMSKMPNYNMNSPFPNNPSSYQPVGAPTNAGGGWASNYTGGG